MAFTPSQRGARAEAAVAAALVAHGVVVYVPVFGAYAAADLVFSDERGFHGVQCKTARRVGNALSFRTSSNTNNVPKAYGAEVEFFGVYSWESDEVFLVPAEGMPNRICLLRLQKPLNGQKKRIRWAGDYLIGDRAPHQPPGSPLRMGLTPSRSGGYRVAAAGGAATGASPSHSTRGASDHSLSRS